LSRASRELRRGASARHPDFGPVWHGHSPCSAVPVPRTVIPNAERNPSEPLFLASSGGYCVAQPLLAVRPWPVPRPHSERAVGRDRTRSVTPSQIVAPERSSGARGIPPCLCSSLFRWVHAAGHRSLRRKSTDGTRSVPKLLLYTPAPVAFVIFHIFLAVHASARIFRHV
jgi:hypothetical protein